MLLLDTNGATISINHLWQRTRMEVKREKMCELFEDQEKSRSVAFAHSIKPNVSKNTNVQSRDWNVSSCSSRSVEFHEKVIITISRICLSIFLLAWTFVSWNSFKRQNKLHETSEKQKRAMICQGGETTSSQIIYDFIICCQMTYIHLFYDQSTFLCVTSVGCFLLFSFTCLPTKECESEKKCFLHLFILPFSVR